MHVCVFDRDCWRAWREFGMPMRVYVGSVRYFTIPFLSGNRRSKKLWEQSTPR